MKIRKTLMSVFAVLIISSIVLAACAAPEPEVIVETVEVIVEVEGETIVETVEVVVEVDAPEVPTGTLVRAISTFPNSLDHPQAAERQASTTAWQMYDSLVWTGVGGTIVPQLAESWEASADGLEYTFYLREDVVFHNGEPFNADAVIFNWDRVVTSDFEYAYHWQEATAVEAVDEYTVKVTIEAPNVLFLSTVADNWAMIPPGYFAEVGQEGFNEHPMGTGPYKFVEWKKGDHITMEANLDYWRGAPKMETVIFRPIPESATRVAAIQTGEVDIVTRQ